MKKGFKILIIVICCIGVLALAAGLIAHYATGKSSNAEEYELGNDTVKSVKAVVDKRDVSAVSTATKNGIKTKKITYQSDTVQDDLIKYVQYLRGEGGFDLTRDMNLSQIPGIVQLGKESEDAGKILIMTIEYDRNEYTVTLEKGKGNLNRY